MWTWAENIGGFFRDMFRHWVGKVTGGLSLITASTPLALPQLFVGDKGLLFSRVLFLSVSVVAFFCASLSAWVEKKNALCKAQRDLEDAIDKNRPEVTAEFTMGPTKATYMQGGPQVKLVNRGASDAWNPRIKDVSICGHTVSFHCPSIIEKDNPCFASCVISGIDINSANALEHLLHKGVREQLGKAVFHGEGTEISERSYKITFDLDVEWNDSRNNPFASLGRVTYWYANRMATTAFPSGIRRLPKDGASR
jgi:hypothetical protein